jgi:flagellar biosynthesis protein FlhG
MSNLKIIGIASGKGGVGKTTISTNLAVALAESGHQVMLFDGDLGLANALLGIGIQAEYNFSHVISGEKSLKEIVIRGPSGIYVVPGASGIGKMANLSEAELRGVVQSFSEFQEPLDYLIVDAAAGIAPSVTTFLKACHETLVVVRDEPSSIADAYGIIKVLATEHDYKNIGLIPNAVPDQRSGQLLYQRLNAVSVKFLNLDLKYIYSIESDETVLEAARKYTPVLTHSAGSTAARDFRKLAKEIQLLPVAKRASGGLQFFVERMLNTDPEASHG